MSSLRLEGVKKWVGDFSLLADFQVESGQRAALIGRSGSGKTTLFRLVAGLERLDQGKIFLGSEEMTALPPQDRNVGVIFQEHSLFPNLTVLENAAFGLRMRGVSRERREAEATLWLDRVGLKSRLHSSVEYLSGGESQRVAFVRALIWKPRVLLLDEPFSALDQELRKALRRELVELHKLWPVPMLLVSHDEADRDEVATQRLEFHEKDDGKIRVVRSSN